jgi:hypothetical protein
LDLVISLSSTIRHSLSMRWVDPLYFLNAPLIRRKFGATRFLSS